MSTVQEIQAALAQLSHEDLERVEQWITACKQRKAEPEAETYGQQEYGLTPEELQRLEERMRAHNAEALRQGNTTVFQGPFDPANLD